MVKLSNEHLIIGATGKTGVRVEQKLREMGYSPRCASRSSHVYFNWDEPVTWAKVLTGIKQVYITYYPDLAVPKAPEDISQFIALAKIKGVQRVVLLSGRGEPAAKLSENIVKQSGISWTIVRAAWFNQNFSEGLFRQYIQQSKIALPVGETKEPFVDIDDIAEIVVAALTTDKHNGKLYEVTGPELLSFAQIAVLFSQRLNRVITFEQVSLSAYQNNLARSGVEKNTIDALSYLFTEVLDGRNESIKNGITEALGRQPKNFSQFIIDNAAYFLKEG